MSSARVSAMPSWQLISEFVSKKEAVWDDRRPEIFAGGV